MYVRVKRRNQTVFLRTAVSDSVQKVKQRLGEVLAVSPDDIKIYAEDKERVLEDEATLGGLEVRDEAVLYWARRIDGSSFEAP